MTENDRHLDIVIVEDDDAVARTWAGYIDMAAPRMNVTVTVHFCTTASDAIELFSSLDRIHGAILDVQLPDGSGLDLIASLRRHHPKAYVVVCSELKDVQLVMCAYTSHANVCLPKPFSFSCVRELVHHTVVQAGLPVENSVRLREVVEELPFTDAPQEGRLVEVARHDQRQDCQEVGRAPDDRG
ncbi:response regulator [Endomicrobium sp. AH-315-J14]|nr:response regulator [Endomicrobium sp. AH-315-J14]